MKYKGLRDKHLNLFFPYGSDNNIVDRIARKEDNITKAFINTLQSLDEKDIKFLIKEVFKINIDFDSNDKYYFDFFLQTTGVDFEVVKKIKKQNRILFGFCPEGETWDIQGIGVNNRSKIMEQLEKNIRHDNPSLSDKDIVKKINEVYLDIVNTINNKNGSRPDGWIFIYKNNDPFYVIALENKRYRLDPYQLTNHFTKSLFLQKEEDRINNIRYCKYKDIVNNIIKCKSNKYIIDSFIEYLIILGYSDSYNFEDAFMSDPDIRHKLAHKFGKQIMIDVGRGPVDDKRKNAWRIKLLNSKYIREINLCFNDGNIESNEKIRNKVYLSLCFGSTQNSAKELYKNIDINEILKLKGVKQSFHIKYQGKNGGRNIWKSYINSWEINDYVSYWKNNINELKTISPEQAVSFYKKLFKENKITKQELQNVQDIMKGKTSKISIVPELLVEIVWEYKDIAKMGCKEFTSEIINTINNYFSILGIE